MLCEVGEEEKRDIQADNGGAGVEKNARFIKRPKSTRRCFSPPSSFCLMEKGGEEVTNRSHEKRQGESENEEDESGI